MNYNSVYLEFMGQYAPQNGAYTREELEALISDLTSMIDNPEVKLTKDEIIKKLKGYINMLNDTPENKEQLSHITGEETVTEGKKDACYRKAKAKYDVFPSAYASGYIAKCRKRKGKIK